ncbi:hypothetical protein [Flavobacterium sp.]|uniref:hypothetical protein n=1 Tax=Flavobacterium sp. TaxID=239 RepID=UPI003D0ED063
MEKIFTGILKLKPGTLAILLMLVPFLAMAISAIITLISIFANFEFIFPLFLISITIAVLIYFIWVWAVVYYVEEEERSNTLYFKISYWIFFSYCLIMFIINLGLDITKKQFLLENSTWAIIGSIAGLYLLIVFFSYIYLSYFISKKLTLLHKNNRIPDFLYFAGAWCFPVGIPFLQAKLLKQKSIFDIISK